MATLNIGDKVFFTVPYVRASTIDRLKDIRKHEYLLGEVKQILGGFLEVQDPCGGLHVVYTRSVVKHSAAGVTHEE